MNGDAATTGNVPRAPRHRWPSDRREAFVSFVLAVVFVLTYVCLHSIFRSNYLDHIEANIANSVMMYGIQAHEQTGELVLSLADKPFSMADAAPGPLGIGDLAATRGWLIQSSNVVETYNARLKAYVERLLAQFDFSRNRPNFVIADLSSIAPRWHQGETKACATANGSQSPQCTKIFRLRVPRESIYHIWHQYPNERTAETLASTIRGSTIEEVETGQGAKPYAGDGAPEKVAEEICENLRRLQSGVRDLFGPFPPTPATTNPEVQGGGQAQATNTRISGCEYFQPTLVSSGAMQPFTPRIGDAGDDEDGDDNNDEGHKKDCGYSALNSQFHCRLAKIVQDNAGFFWTAGKFLWFEIMLLSLLGLAVSRLVQLCKQYIRDEPFVWQSRGLWQTLLLLPATPIVALVIIWILSITNLLSIKPVLGHTWTSATVPIAFLLGLFPHLGYDVLQGLAKGIFNRPLRGWQASRKDFVQRPIPEPPGGAPSDEERPSLDRLSAIIRERFTAPFR